MNKGDVFSPPTTRDMKPNTASTVKVSETFKLRRIFRVFGKSPDSGRTDALKRLHSGIHCRQKLTHGHFSFVAHVGDAEGGAFDLPVTAID